MVEGKALPRDERQETRDGALLSLISCLLSPVSTAASKMIEPLDTAPPFDKLRAGAGLLSILAAQSFCTLL